MANFNRILSNIILHRRILPDGLDIESASCLLGEYESLRRFFPLEERFELTNVFVAFCEQRMGEKKFLKSIKAFKTNRRQRVEKHLPLKNSRYFWKPSQPR